jgi:hypothetical protein
MNLGRRIRFYSLISGLITKLKVKGLIPGLDSLPNRLMGLYARDN